MLPRLANIKKQVVVNIPRPRSIDHPVVESITREIISESNDLFVNDTVTEVESVNQDLTAQLFPQLIKVKDSDTTKLDYCGKTEYTKAVKYLFASMTISPTFM